MRKSWSHLGQVCGGSKKEHGFVIFQRRLVVLTVTLRNFSVLFYLSSFLL